jgi:putative spermidine/putrescine transport system substrate-binding protein
VVQRAVTQPKSYDIADIEYWMAKKVVPTGVLLPLDTQRIKLFDMIVPVFSTGKLTPEAKVAQGTAPHTVEFVTGADSAQLAAEPTRWATLIPTIYNADTLGIRPDLVKRPIDTWAELLNPAFKGRASMVVTQFEI